MPERVLVGSRVALRPVTQGDYELIRMAETTGSDSLIYRHRGVTPSPEEFAASLWRGVLTQWVIAEKASGAPVGVATSYGADFRSGHVYVAGIVFPPFRGHGWPLEGFQLLIDDLFATFGFRKLYGDLYSSNLQQFSSIVHGLGIEEGRLRAHELIAGTYEDRVTVAIYRDDWERHRAERPVFSSGGLLRRIREADAAASGSVG
jgi:RimJ/RimL family protein N-acetyltransferase